MPLTREIAEVAKRIVEQRFTVRRLEAAAAPELSAARHELEQLEAYLEVLRLRREDALAEFKKSQT